MNAGVKRENANQDVSFISRSLKGLAKELDVPVICLSQLSRKSEERVDHRPQLSDLRDSGAIEQDADMVMFLYRDNVYKPIPENRTMAELIVAKNRKGPTDSVNLRFFREFTKFDNCVQEFNGEV
jgi:replicative DNA helicase